MQSSDLIMEMSDAEDFVDFDEEEHAEDAQEQARRLEALRSLSDSTRQTHGDTRQQHNVQAQVGGDVGGNVSKVRSGLDPKAAVFVPKSGAAFAETTLQPSSSRPGYRPVPSESDASSGVPVGAGTKQGTSNVVIQPMRADRKKGWGQFAAGDQPSQSHSGLTLQDSNAKKARIMEGEEQSTSDIKHGKSEAVLAKEIQTASTLAMSRVPQPLNNMTKIAGFFSKFGEIARVTLDIPKCEAFVQFANPAAASAAFNNPHPVLKNRSILLQRLKDYTPNNNNGAQPTAPSTLAHTNATFSDKDLGGADTADVLEHSEPLKKRSYRAPATVLAAKTSISAAVGLYDDLDARPADKARSVNKEIERATLKVRLHERKHENSKAKMTSLADKMKGVKEKLNELSKQGKNIDPTAKASVMAEMIALASEIKTEQAAVKSAEANLQAARKEHSNLLASSTSQSGSSLPSTGTQTTEEIPQAQLRAEILDVVKPDAIKGVHIHDSGSSTSADIVTMDKAKMDDTT